MSSNASVEVRAARPDDAARIGEINETSWKAAYRGLIPDGVLARMRAADLAAAWRAYIVQPDSPEDRLWVALLGPEVVAYARSGPPRDDDLGREVAEVYGFYVDPPAWGRGAGRALMEHLTGDLAGRGYQRVVLWVARDNERARRFYAALGFAPDGRADKPFHGAPQLRLQRLP